MDFQSFKNSCYQKRASAPDLPRVDSSVASDIVLHLPVLEYFASLCDHVVEFGVREGNSTAALIAGCRGEVHSFDIQPSPIVDSLRAMSLPCSNWRFLPLNTGDEQSAELVPETDLLFIDTLHTYAHVVKELRLHGRKARKFLVFHDTATCGEFDVSGTNPHAMGIMPAIEEFLNVYQGQYEVTFKTSACNGLLVLSRKPPQA